MFIGKNPPVHLWIFNHPFYWISDQIDFFVSLFKQRGFTVTVGRQPNVEALNVVIENFTAVTNQVLIDFCKTYNKKVGVIMTEHLDFIRGELYIHGKPLWSQSDYMSPVTQVGRHRMLFECVPYIRSLFVLGDLPKLINVNALFPGMDMRWLPFPEIEGVNINDKDNDMIFTGVSTKFRQSLIFSLREKGIGVTYPENRVSRKKRDEMYRSHKMILNIPQDENWEWLSLMRIMAGLRCGCATISIATNDTSKISGCTIQIDGKDPQLEERLKDYIKNSDDVYTQALENYAQLSREFEKEHPFPIELFELWAVTDRLKLSGKRKLEPIC